MPHPVVRPDLAAACTLRGQLMPQTQRAVSHSSVTTGRLRIDTLNSDREVEDISNTRPLRVTSMSSFGGSKEAEGGYRLSSVASTPSSQTYAESALRSRAPVRCSIIDIRHRKGTFSKRSFVEYLMRLDYLSALGGSGRCINAVTGELVFSSPDRKEIVRQQSVRAMGLAEESKDAPQEDCGVASSNDVEISSSIWSCDKPSGERCSCVPGTGMPLPSLSKSNVLTCSPITVPPVEAKGASTDTAPPSAKPTGSAKQQPSTGVIHSRAEVTEVDASQHFTFSTPMKNSQKRRHTHHSIRDNAVVRNLTPVFIQVPVEDAAEEVLCPRCSRPRVPEPLPDCCFLWVRYSTLRKLHNKVRLHC